MGVLNRLFGSTEAVAKEMQLDEEGIIELWKDYLGTIPKKKVFVEKLRIGANLKSDLEELRLLLITELTSISGEEKKESELISDLEFMEHSEKVKRVHTLEQCLGYAETKYDYVYHLLHQLHSFLKFQMHIADKLLAGSKNAEKLISHLKQQLELELEIIKKIEQIQTFHDLFLALAKGEHIIKTMDAQEKRLLKKMQKGMGKIFSKEITEGITHEWAIEVYNQVQDLVEDHTAIVAMGRDPHVNVDFELVNSPEFISIVRETIQNLKKRKVSDQMITVFVHLFRELYNYGRG